MEFLLVFLYLIFLLWLKYFKMDYPSKRILLIFTTYWFIALFLSQFELYGLDMPKNLSVFLLIINVFAFIIGFSLIKINSNSLHRINIKTFEVQFSLILKNKIFIFILIIALLYVAYLVGIYYTKFIFLQSLGDLRTEYYDSNLYGSLFSTINTFFLSPFFIFLLPIYGYSTLYKRNMIWFFILLFLLLFATLSGGRADYLKLFLPIMLIILFQKKKKAINNKFSRYIIIYFSLFLSIIIISYVSAARFGNIELSKSNLQDGFDITTEQIVTYSVGPIVAFDYALNINYLNQINGYKYGTLTLNSIENIFYSIVSKFGLIYERPISQFANLKQYTPIQISNEFSWNALYTWVLFFYLDFGIVGVIFFPFMIGLIFRKVIKEYIRNPNIYYFIILYFIFQLSLFSVMDWSLSSPALLFFLVLMYILAKKTSKKNQYTY